jgi:sulfatase maturation enzyme AslB (radical SAM superfamily)
MSIFQATITLSARNCLAAKNPRTAIVDLKGIGVLQVEPTDQCNLKCTMCAPHRDGWEQIHGVPKGYLSVPLWKSILEDLAASGHSFDHIIFQWLGDPLLHPQIEDLIAQTAVHLAGKVGYLRIDTNGILLDSRRIDALLSCGMGGSPPLLIVFSLDAASAETYGKVKGRSHFSRVQRNIREVVRRRRQLGVECRINLQLQFVVQEGNAGETKAFMDYWCDLLGCQGGLWHDEIMFKRLSVDGGAQGQAEADALYASSIFGQGIEASERQGVQIGVWEKRPWQRDDGHQGGRSACPGLWMTPVIRHDGALMMCCADLRGELRLGSLSESSFSELWFGEQAVAHRLDHLRGDFKGPCISCGGINWYSLSEERSRSTLERASSLHLT